MTSSGQVRQVPKFIVHARARGKSIVFSIHGNTANLSNLSGLTITCQSASGETETKDAEIEKIVSAKSDE